MSGNYNNTSGYSAADIQKYWRGELSAQEMHELEKAALEDPFLADALEGMQTRQHLPEPAAFDRDLEELQTRLEKRVTQSQDKKAIPFLRPRTRIAAAIILLAGLGSAAYFAFLKTSWQKEPVASALHAKKDEAPQVSPQAAPLKAEPDSSSMAPSVASNSQQTDKEKKEAGSPARAKNSTNLPRRPADLSDRQPAPVADLPSVTVAPRLPSLSSENGLATIRKDTVTTPSGVGNSGVQFFGNSDSSAHQGFAARSRSNTLGYSPGNRNGIVGESRTNRSIDNRLAVSGKVLDEHNRPLYGASVYLNGHSDISTVTDRHGLFNLKLLQQQPDSALKVMVAYLGYQQTSVAFNILDQQNVAGNIIRLQPQHPSLDEVVVVGYGTKRKETFGRMTPDGEENIDSLWLKATPVSGRLIYLDYLAAARGKLLLDSTIKGDEIVSFDVNKKGELSSFRVEQSLSPAHDSTIIRLVREGPPWKLLRGRQARAAVKVSF